MVMLWTVVVVGALAVLLLVARPHCSHVDADGRTTLMWATHKGRLRGFCFECQQWTTGWPLAARSWWVD